MFSLINFIILERLFVVNIFSNLCLYKICEHAIIKTTLTRRGAFYHGKNIKAATGYYGFHKGRSKE